jgi:RHS repeat-associated protein
VLTEFDALGRVYRQSFPCLIGSCAAPFWTTNSYDLANRLTQSQRPISASNSTPQTTTRYYEGLTQRLIDPLNKESRRIVDVTGGVRRIQDHDGYQQNFGHDAAGSVLSVTDSLSNALLSMTYDYGTEAFRRTSNDSDMGAWGYTYNALGEMTAHTDAKGQSFLATFDALSRPLTRRDAVNGANQETLTTWIWGNSAASFNIGKLASVSTVATSTYTDTFTFDNKSRLSQRSSFNSADAGGTTHNFNYTYNASTGLLETVQYPTSTSSYRLKLLYTYQNGQQLNIKEFAAQSTVFWAANLANARGQISQQTFGNGVVTNRGFDAVTGLMGSQTAGVGGGTGLQNESYLFDQAGNVTQRQNNTLSLTESFYYDNLYRLDYSTLKVGAGSPTTNLDLTYDALGNITNKSDVGAYDYTTAQSGCSYYANNQRHAVRNAGGTVFCYDANGNMTRRGAATNTITWTSYNYPSQIVASATENIGFLYGPDRQRWRTQYVNGATTETTYHVGKEFQKVITTSTDFRHTIYAGSRAIAVYSRKSTGTNTLRYILEDHQGSVANILASNGTSYVKENFSAFGTRRNPATWSGAPSSGDLTLINGVTREGYTWQTALGAMGLNHMNGRVQDAITGRFISPDPYLQDPELTQTYNRYAYVNNNPLTFTDPTGFDACTIFDPEPCIDGPTIYADGSFDSGISLFWNDNAYAFQYDYYLPHGVPTIFAFDDPNVIYPHGPTSDYVFRGLDAFNKEVEAAEEDKILFNIDVTATAVELASARATIGTNWKSFVGWYSSGWKGNQYVSVVEAAKLFKLAGAAASAVGLYNDYLEFQAGTMSPLEFLTRTGLTGAAVATSYGAIPYLLYEGVEAYYPGGWEGLRADYYASHAADSDSPYCCYSPY